MSILVLAAHPDDEVLGCGGTIVHLAKSQSVHIAIFGEGVTSRYGQREHADPEELQQLRQTAENVGAFLGAKSVRCFGLPDNRFDTVALLDIVKFIEGLIDELQPHTVFTQHGGDLNVDHMLLYRAALTATRPVKGQCVRRLYSYEVNSSSEWSFQRFSPVFRPTTYIDISDTLENKIAAMELYESEARAYPHPRSPKALRAVAQRHGTVIGCDAAEAFECIREHLDWSELP